MHRLSGRDDSTSPRLDSSIRRGFPLPLFLFWILSAGCGGSKTTGPDTTPPAAVSDLRVTGATPTTLSLAWTAPGDDGTEGTAASYEIRRATFTITAANFSTADSVSAPAPAAGGATQSMTLTGLTPDTRYTIALRSRDDADNVSPLSNVLAADTQPEMPGPRLFRATPDGTGSDCGSLQDCLNAAADGDTVELTAGPGRTLGFYRTPADTLVDDGMGNLVVANMVVKSGIVIRAAAGDTIRVDGTGDRIGLVVPAGLAPVTVRGLRFDNCAIGLRITGGTHRVEACSFVTGLHGMVADGAELNVTGTVFSEFGAEAVLARDCAGAFTDCEFWGNNYGIFSAQSRDLVFDRIVMAFACLTGVRIEEGGTATLRRMTIFGAGMVPGDSTAIVVAGGASVAIDRCVVSGNRGFGVHCRTGGTVTVACSDFFANSSGNFAGCVDPTGTNGVIALDPLFCDTASLDFRLAAGSPARLAACGVMGAFGDAPCGSSTGVDGRRRRLSTAAFALQR